MKKLLLLCALATPVWANSAPVYNGVYWPAERAGQQVLLKNGYHDIQITAMQDRPCPDKSGMDNNSVNFRAISPKNHVVTGMVCDGKVYPLITTVTEPK